MIELDKRIVEGKKPLTAFDEVAGKFIGTECYFSDDAIDFGNVVLNCQKGRLLSIGELTGSFNATKNNSYANFNYCLPCEWVKEEPKYRPFSLNEFLNQYHLGDEIIVRRKLNKERSIHKLFTEYGGNDNTIHLGTYWFTFQDLYDNYEIFRDAEWKPFGIEVEE